MTIARRTLAAGLGGLLLVSAVAGCAEETELTEADQSQLPTEELIGSPMTLENEVQEILMDETITVGAEDTVVVAEQLPDELGVGDTVEVTGTVEKADVFTIDDYEALQEVTDDETAQYFVDRGEELILVDATVTVVE